MSPAEKVIAKGYAFGTSYHLTLLVNGDEAGTVVLHASMNPAWWPDNTNSWRFSARRGRWPWSVKDDMVTAIGKGLDALQALRDADKRAKESIKLAKELAEEMGEGEEPDPAILEAAARLDMMRTPAERERIARLNADMSNMRPI
jgi:hypothetical protein